MKILVDSHEFRAPLDTDGTKQQLKELSDTLRISLGKADGAVIELVDEAFLVLGPKQLERAVFVFCCNSQQ